MKACEAKAIACKVKAKSYMSELYRQIKIAAEKGYSTISFDKYELSDVCRQILIEDGYNVSVIYEEDGIDNRVKGYSVSW